MRFVYAALFLLVASLTTRAESLIKIESQHGVKQTVDRLAAAIEKRGIKIAARIDHAAATKAADLELAPTGLVIFGNPKLGTPLMQEGPTMGIDLPMKILTWQDNSGKVWMTFPDPEDLEFRHGVKTHDEIFAKMRKALDGLTQAAGGQ
ncbi:MAG: DUF302 domain-containing protein [Hyphomicrobiaceae bacterium]|nr:DUF302 domain-containing protein [Hyphomicrobiaceae bacterium]